MRVSKQYIYKPLKRLIEQGYMLTTCDPSDRRIKRLSLSTSGCKLEAELSGNQRERFAEVFRQAGRDAEEGWRRVMALLACK